MRKLWERPHEYEGKIIHVGTPGIFHAPHPEAPLGLTYCGLPMDDARATDHELLDQQPCSVCFAARKERAA
jgi:hypothetical protein